MSKQQVVRVTCKGRDLLRDPLLNKGTAFTEKERKVFGLNGLLPPHVSTLEEQIQRLYENFRNKRTALDQYKFLLELMGRNCLLFYQFVERYVAEMIPILYTPTVGHAALEYSQLYVQPRGLYLSYPMRDQLGKILQEYSAQEVQVIVATDGERILGLGDQGIGGMTIPIGKLSLYTLFGGIHPAKTLPIFLDVGTNNPSLLSNKLYLGWRHERIVGKEYDRFIDQFVETVHQYFPKVLIQWEDFGKDNARRVLNSHRARHLSFNDDIQGTAAVTLAGVLAALSESKKKITDQTIAILGGGSAGTGIADMFVSAMRKEGFSQEESCRKIYLVNREGLIHFNSKKIEESQKEYVHPAGSLKDWKVTGGSAISLWDIIVNAHPTILIGVSGQGGAFTKQMIEEMARHVRRPIIFPLSNPTANTECTPQEILEWTCGRAIIATGSPFFPVSYEGRAYTISQCNNVYIFPGVGAGALAARAKEVTDSMLMTASMTLARHSPVLKNSAAPLFPPLEEVRSISREIAIAVGKQAICDQVSSVKSGDIVKRVDQIMWKPHYPKFIKG